MTARSLAAVAAARGPLFLAGGAWGLGLARLLAEGGFLTPFYISPWAVALVALAVGGLVAALSPTGKGQL
ncbi:MAG TPA: hypothetical protein ENK56_04440 [Chloroflexi bacterium]|nr:hypothetical protein [Chloroflexota bacterium]